MRRGKRTAADVVRMLELLATNSGGCVLVVLTNAERDVRRARADELGLAGAVAVVSLEELGRG